MSNEELIKILKEFQTTRVEKLNDNSKRLFYAIMKIADERDNLKEENQRLNNDIKVLLKENEAKEKVIIKQNNVLNELEKWVYQFREEHKNDTGIFDKFLTTREVLDKLNELKESDK